MLACPLSRLPSCFGSTSPPYTAGRSRVLPGLKPWCWNFGLAWRLAGKVSTLPRNTWYSILANATNRVLLPVLIIIYSKRDLLVTTPERTSNGLKILLNSIVGIRQLMLSRFRSGLCDAFSSDKLQSMFNTHARAVLPCP